MKQKSITAIVVNWNGKKFLKDCFSTLQNQDYKNFEMVMVDNASVDKSVEYVNNNFPNVKTIRSSENRGFGAAINIAINNTKSDYIIFLNNDVSFEKNFLSELAKELEPDSVGGVSPKLMLFDKPKTINYAGGIVNYLGYTWPRFANKKDRPLKTIETPFAGILMFKRNLIKSIGAFDDLFFLYHEDSDLCWRIRYTGKKILFVPSAVMYHKYEFSRTSKKLMYLEKGRLLLILKNYSLKTLILISPMILISEIGSIGYSILNGWFFEKLKSYYHLLKNAGRICKGRKRMKKFKKVSDRLFVKQFVGYLRYEELKNPIITHFFSPIYEFYWSFIKKLL